MLPTLHLTQSGRVEPQVQTLSYHLKLQVQLHLQHHKSQKEEKRKSIIWNHCRQSVVNKVTITYCNHCGSHWSISGSTSTALQHLRQNHQEFLTDAEVHQLFSDNEPTAFDAKAPKRQVKCYGDMTSKILHNSLKGLKLNKYLCLAMVSGSVSWNLLDNPQFAIFVEHLSIHQYNLPSRTYMLTCVMPGVHEACKEGVKALLKNKKNISFTTDAWRSINRDSYITITAHVIDDKLELHSIVLDTSEMKKRHTSVNLFNHIKDVLQDWGLNSDADYVALNYNNTNANDIFADEEEADDGVDFMQALGCYDNDDHLSPMSESQTEMSEMSESQTQMPESQIVTEPSSSRSHERNVNVVNSEDDLVTMTWVSDNAGDIKKALSVNGHFNWVGCAGHHLNLVVKEAFEKVRPAAELLRKCKLVVQTINHSIPILNYVRDLQVEFGIGLSAIIQEMIVRWWSILEMLKSIEKSYEPIILALHSGNKSHIALAQTDLKQIKDMIGLLEPFQDIGEQFSKESDVTITLILPCFKHLEKKVLNPKPDDSQMIKDMKTHMLQKLKNRYNDDQMAFLKILAFLDPRFKGDVTPDMTLLKSKIKKFCRGLWP